jgi:GNAT superfamily N-acetyltransferase
MIREVFAPAAEAGLAQLADILVDAVTHGASVNFLTGFSAHEAQLFWAGQLPGLRAGSTRLFVAEQAGEWLGTVLLFMAHQPNAPHRAEIGKMLVRSTARRRGLGRALLTAAETAALAAGRSLLLLDTESGSAGDLLYRAAGWVEYGRVPGHALRPDGQPAETTMFYKRLDAGIKPA